MRIWAGIDPGKSGAVAWIKEDGTAEAFFSPVLISRKKTRSKLKSGPNAGHNKLRTAQKIHHDLPGRFRLLLQLVALKAAGHDVLVTLEHASSRPKDGKAQAFSFGYDFGSWEMALVALGLPYQTVTPAKWRVEMVGQGKPKAESLKKARRLFPSVSLPLAKDEAKAEALLIAEWQRQRERSLNVASVT